MKSRDEAIDLMAATQKEMEKALGIPIRNGQTRKAIIKTLAWVIR